MRNGSRGVRAGRRPGRGWTVLTGVVVALAYLAGAMVSSRHDPLARRPLLDGLAPPPPYHWVKPPPALAAGNKPPSAARAVVRLTASGSAVSAIATGDGQASLVLEAGAIAPSPGQREVAVSITPVDPGTLAPAPPGLLLAGNAYRIRLAYRPSGAAARLAGRATAVLVFPLLASPVASSFDYTMLASPDGKAWTRQSSTATPGSHQVSAVLPAPGYVVAAVPPAPPAAPASPNRIPLIAVLAAAAAVIIIAAAVLARRLRRSGNDDDYDEEYEEDGGDLDPDHGAEDRR
ncbi:MAG TPA: hypothetical protein VFA46_06890 [Actinomycetes bacterium]|jgi:hypothetical protein|nr:hypothetical protein [Actinomycetes bacterium]